MVLKLLHYNRATVGLLVQSSGSIRWLVLSYPYISVLSQNKDWRQKGGNHATPPIRPNKVLSINYPIHYPTKNQGLADGKKRSLQWYRSSYLKSFPEQGLAEVLLVSGMAFGFISFLISLAALKTIYEMANGAWPRRMN
jgi:hypothetical protein